MDFKTNRILNSNLVLPNKLLLHFVISTIFYTIPDHYIHCPLYFYSSQFYMKTTDTHKFSVINILSENNVFFKLFSKFRQSVK